MQNYTKTDVNNIRTELQEAMNKVLTKYGSVGEIDTIIYGADIRAKNAISKVEENEHGKYVHSKKAREFLNRAKSLGFEKSVLNEPCNYLVDTYIVTGYNSRAKWYPIEFTKDGEARKSTVAYISTIIKAEHPEYLL